MIFKTIFNLSNLFYIFGCFFGYFCLQEGEIETIQSLISNIKNENLSEESEELAKLIIENNKLKFRLQILNRVRKKARQQLSYHIDLIQISN